MRYLTIRQQNHPSGHQVRSRTFVLVSPVEHRTQNDQQIGRMQKEI